MSGVREDYKSDIILVEGSSESEIITNLPLPASAVPSISLMEAPLPMPIEEILAFLDFCLAI